MSIFTLGVVVFLSTLALDVIQAFSFEAYQRRDANTTTILSVVEYAIGVFAFYAFVTHSWWLVVPELAGLVVGSQVSVRYLKAREARAACQT